MAKFVDWKDGGSSYSGGGDGGGQFLKLQGGNSYTVRLVGKAVRYMQHWEPVICRSPGVDEETKQVIDPLMIQGYQPKPRYAIWVFHRDDGNKLKVMDFPGVLYDQFKDWACTNNADPGREQGPDWIIKLEVPGGDKRRTKYRATAKMNATPFTAEEIKLLKESKFHEKLIELRKANTPDEIRGMLAKRSGENSTATAAQEETRASASAPTPAASVEKPEDDIF